VLLRRAGLWHGAALRRGQPGGLGAEREWGHGVLRVRPPGAADAGEGPAGQSMGHGVRRRRPRHLHHGPAGEDHLLPLRWAQSAGLGHGPEREHHVLRVRRSRPAHGDCRCPRPSPIGHLRRCGERALHHRRGGEDVELHLRGPQPADQCPRPVRQPHLPRLRRAWPADVDTHAEWRCRRPAAHAPSCALLALR